MKTLGRLLRLPVMMFGFLVLVDDFNLATAIAALIAYLIGDIMIVLETIKETRAAILAGNTPSGPPDKNESVK